MQKDCLQKISREKFSLKKVAYIMNDELKELVLQAGAPEEVMDTLWFNLFCIKFADILLTLAEETVSES